MKKLLAVCLALAGCTSVQENAYQYTPAVGDFVYVQNHNIGSASIEQVTMVESGFITTRTVAWCDSETLWLTRQSYYLPHHKVIEVPEAIVSEQHPNFDIAASRAELLGSQSDSLL